NVISPTFTFATPGTYTVSLSASNSCNTDNTYSKVITVGGCLPQIQVLDGATNIANITGSVDFGSTTIGTPVTKTFTIKNVGPGTLSLGALSALPAGFSLVGSFPTANIASGGSSTFSIKLDAVSVGNYSGTLSFVNGDATKNPFNFTITGTVVPLPAPQIQVLDGATNIANGSGSVNFGSTFIGTPVAKTFTIKNNGTAALSLGALSALPAGFSLVGSFPTANVPPAGSTTFQVKLDGTVLGNYSGNLIFANGDATKNPFNFNITGTVVPLPAPQIQVLDGASNIANGGNYDFGTTLLSTPLTKTFTIKNNGTAALSLGALSALPAGFSLVGSFPSASIPAGSSSTFQVKLDAVSLGNYSGSLSFVNGDATKNPFNFNITGTVVSVPVAQIQVLDGGTNITNISGSVDFSSTPIGTPITKTFTIKNIGTAALSLGALSALPAGFSLVGTFPTANIPAAGSATFQVKLDGVVLGNYSGSLSFVNGDASKNPFNFAITGTVIPLPVPQIQVLDGATNITNVTGSVDFGSTSVGTPVTKTFTIKNNGTAALSLGAFSALPAGFSLIGTFPTASIAAGGSTNFSVKLDAVSVGNYSGSLSFVNGDATKNPFNFNITGTVVALPAPQIQVLDGATNIANITGNVDFGSTPIGTPITKTFTIKNNGTAALSLGALSALPTGFSLVGAFPTANIPAAGSATFQVKLDGIVLGNYSGSLIFVNGDATKNPFNFVISGTVTSTAAPQIQVLESSTNIPNASAYSFGSTQQSIPVTKTFTIKNIGTAPLTLGVLSALPTGFSLVGTFPTSNIAAGSSSTFSIQLDASSTGTYSGSLSFVNGDATKNPFSISISGTVTANTVGLNEINYVKGISIYPNPANNKLNVSTITNFNNASISLYDVTGKLVMKKSNIDGQTQTIDISQFCLLLYFVVINLVVDI
ncbi:MAG: choice-of-anchor D domain-containing protein, partial [Bacteroidota bacterium]